MTAIVSIGSCASPTSFASSIERVAERAEVAARPRFETDSFLPPKRAPSTVEANEIAASSLFVSD